jgi:hypothetical protein
VCLVIPFPINVIGLSVSVMVQKDERNSVVARAGVPGVSRSNCCSSDSSSSSSSGDHNILDLQIDLIGVYSAVGRGEQARTKGRGEFQRGLLNKSRGEEREIEGCFLRVHND